MLLPSLMKAIGFRTSLSIEEQNSLIAFSKNLPKVLDNDVLVKVQATSINPVDAKIRKKSAKNNDLELPRVTGYDAVGTIVVLGKNVEGFQLGDRIYYAGNIIRQGAHAEYQAVDFRIVSHAPVSLSDESAAVMPLVTLTAWEALFDRLRIRSEEKKTLLVIGGAGGVGSIAIQLAAQLTNITIICTASRPKSVKWVKDMGAEYVVNHRNIIESVRQKGFQYVDYILNAADTKRYWWAMVELIAPQGMICSIVEFGGSVELSALQGKSAGFIWELMFTRSLFSTEDIQKQQDILFRVAQLIDSGRIKPILTKTLNGFNIETFKEAHRLIESNTTIGKIAIKF